MDGMKLENMWDATFLHLAAWYNHPHLVPYLISVFPEAVQIKSNSSFTP